MVCIWGERGEMNDCFWRDNIRVFETTTGYHLWGNQNSFFLPFLDLYFSSFEYNYGDSTN